MKQTDQLYACIRVREFAAQALLRLRPELRCHPCAVMEGETPLLKVCSMNAKARALGVVHGTTRSEIETFADITTLQRNRGEEEMARNVLLECAGTYSPRIEERWSNHSYLCVLDITGIEKLFGPPLVVTHMLLERMKALGFSVSIAVSHNFDTSICVARSLSGPEPVAVIDPGQEGKALAPLPVSVINPSETHRQTFVLWGIHTLGMLAELPERELIARMGQEGKRLRQLARGEMPHLFLPVEASFALEEHMDLDTPVQLLDSLLFVLGLMLEQLILRAVNRIVALASVTVTLSLEGGNVHARTVKPALPGNDRTMWLKLLHLDLEAHPPSAAIIGLSIVAQSGTTSKVQLGLFTPQLPESMRLDVTLARIRAIVGEQCVGRARLQDTHRRENFSIEPFSVPSVSTASAKAQPLQAVLRTLRPAERIAVTLRDSRPVGFHFRDRSYGVEDAYGPWHTSGEWWQPTLWHDEQWDVVARCSRDSLLCCCLMHDLTDHSWQMVALYD